MRLSRASTYALQAVAYMAGQNESQPIGSHVIAQKRRIPKRFLLKVLKPLVSAQVLYSVRGHYGGYRLARAANNISVLEIVEAVDGPIRDHAPPGRDPASDLQRKLHQICSQSAQALRKQLGKIKLAELACATR